MRTIRMSDTVSTFAVLLSAVIYAAFTYTIKHIIISTESKQFFNSKR